MSLHCVRMGGASRVHVKSLSHKDFLRVKQTHQSAITPSPSVLEVTQAGWPLLCELLWMGQEYE